MPEITLDEAHALEGLLVVMRPDWDAQDTRAVLWNGRTMAAAEDLMCAAIRAAADENIRTPSVITRPGKHWRDAELVVFDRPPPTRRCSICSLGRDDCEARWAGDHEYEPIEHPSVNEVHTHPEGA